MKNPLSRLNLSYANVIATVALFIAVGGGTAWAANTIAIHSVGTPQLKTGAVTARQVRDGSLLAKDFRSGQLPGASGGAGAPGSDGAQGPAGPRGAQGETGDRGAPGAPGAPGTPGEAGERGPRGYQGEPGEPGREGEAGEPGPRGARGIAGPEGEPGERGETGRRGERGPQGEPGEEGPEGQPGIVRTITRYGPEVRALRGAVSYAACKGKEEVVTGGGYAFTTVTRGQAYTVWADRASQVEEISEEELEGREEEGEVVAEGEGEGGEFFAYPPPKDGSTLASGWAVSMEPVGGKLSAANFRAYVNCAVVASSSTLSQANQEGQQVLELLR